MRQGDEVVYVNFYDFIELCHTCFSMRFVHRFFPMIAQLVLLNVTFDFQSSNFITLQS